MSSPSTTCQTLEPQRCLSSSGRPPARDWFENGGRLGGAETRRLLGRERDQTAGRGAAIAFTLPGGAGRAIAMAAEVRPATGDVGDPFAAHAIASF